MLLEEYLKLSDKLDQVTRERDALKVSLSEANGLLEHEVLPSVKPSFLAEDIEKHLATSPENSLAVREAALVKKIAEKIRIRGWEMMEDCVHQIADEIFDDADEILQRNGVKR